MLNFDKKELGNLEYSLQREVLCTNRTGGYLNTTIVGCNTRKYHGLMVCPVEAAAGENFVLLSSLDETVIQHEQEFNLGIHRFPGTYEPRGHKYIVDFSYSPNMQLTYRVGGVKLKKEYLWIHSREQLLIRYTLLEARSDTKLRLRPFLAFRRAHDLSTANMMADTRSHRVENGVMNALYQGLPSLYMQTDREAEFVSAPDWYYRFEYLEEKKRGYPYQEDLLTTGFFELEIKKGESLIFSASTSQVDPANLSRQFAEELARRSPKDDFLPCLRHAARQFLVCNDGKSEVIAGYPWFGRWGRDTFISLPGITLTQGNVEGCRAVIDTMVSEMQDGLFPNMGNAYNSVDAPLWFFWTLQQLQDHIGAEAIWQAYGPAMKSILEAFTRGINGGAIRVEANGLVWASKPGVAFTWMDAVVDGDPVTGRDGFQVEINALWYNAICYTLELARQFDDAAFATQWEPMPDKIKASFNELFWYEKEGYLADYVDAQGRQNTYIRPNQIIACSLPYTMLTEERIARIIPILQAHLLTPKGLRTLSPRNPLYEGHYEGAQPERDRQYHQGTVWPWLLEHYVKACFDLKGKGYIFRAEEILGHFVENMTLAGIGSISEIYDGDPPHHPRGAISQAWSVGALLRINEMIDRMKK
ncbi:MAG: amylo-alpha-1,6-glucosidase [Rikenellaceae bacterium]|jgi:predicted glycogen debranching enzyme|nr:amylo-alpha-1,6-glucosidase [Rikenellaceae bacterium]